MVRTTWDGWRKIWDSVNLTNPITGTGTSGYLPIFIGTGSLGNSPLYSDGTNVGIGTTPNAFLEVAGGTTGRVQISDGGGGARKALILEQPGYGGNSFSRIQTYNYGDDTFPNLSLQTAGGFVGVGYPSDPTSNNKLAVNGNSYFNGSVTATSLAGTGTRIVTANTSGQLGILSGTGFVKADGSVDSNSYEKSLGTPSADGYVLSSTTSGIRSWVAPSAADAYKGSWNA